MGREKYVAEPQTGTPLEKSAQVSLIQAYIAYLLTGWNLGSTKRRCFDRGNLLDHSNTARRISVLNLPRHPVQPERQRELRPTAAILRPVRISRRFGRYEDRTRP